MCGRLNVHFLSRCGKLGIGYEININQNVIIVANTSIFTVLKDHMTRF